MNSKRHLQRKKNLEDKLSKHGINDLKISYLPYLDYNEFEFVKPYEAGCRMMILYAAAYVAAEQDEREWVSDWLKQENIWSHVSLKEKELFEGKIADEKDLLDFMWDCEGAYILEWSLSIVDNCPPASEEVSDENLDNFMDKVPIIGESLSLFLSNLSYRNIEEIYDENLFNELATTYFRNQMYNRKPNASNIDKYVSFSRHKTLNWLRRFSGIEEWDDVDTST